MANLCRCCLASEQSLREVAGYTGGNVSTNGLLVVGNKRDSDMTIGALTVPTKPTYFGPWLNWPFGSPDEAKTELAKNASVAGAGDGWRSPDPV